MQTTSKVPFPLLLRSALIAIIISIVLNNLWYLILTKGAGYEGGPVNFLSITMGSTVPLVIAALIFFGLSKLTAKYRTIYLVGAIILTLLSLYGSFQPQLPDGSPTPAGFALLTVPMHLIAGTIAIYLIPKTQTKHHA